MHILLFLLTIMRELTTVLTCCLPDLWQTVSNDNPTGSWSQPPSKGRMRPTRQAPPQRLGPQVRPWEMVRQRFFPKEGGAPPATASLLLLLAGDVETNPGPSCYACGQNFRQSDTPLNCHAQDCGVRSHKQTRCSGVPRYQQSLPWHSPTHGGPGPPVTT